MALGACRSIAEIDGDRRGAQRHEDAGALRGRGASGWWCWPAPVQRTPRCDLFLVDPEAAGVALDQRYSISSDAQYRVELDGVRVPLADRIGAAGSGWATWSAVMARRDGPRRGLRQRWLPSTRSTITVQYSKDREQFDKPLGAFQALAHYMADAKTAVDGAKLITYEAACGPRCRLG